MKFYTISKLLTRVEEQEYGLLHGIRLDPYGTRSFNSMKIDKWGSGWIFEADDHFQSYCIMAYGFSPTPIHEEEYYQLVRDGVLFFSKDRIVQLKESIGSQYKFIEPWR